MAVAGCLCLEYDHILSFSKDLALIFQYYIPRLLFDPNLESPANHDAAELLKHDEGEYKQVVRGKETVGYLNCRDPVREDTAYVDTAPCVKGGGHLYAVGGDLLAPGFNLNVVWNL
ncbi:hypothetical protein K1719_044289 [Acacia pycnantha]|nr:hypothetical protein K1719_044289 [Acacia pycnantha]